MDEEGTRLTQVFSSIQTICLKKSRLELSKIAEKQLEENQKDIVKRNEYIGKNN